MTIGEWTSKIRPNLEEYWFWFTQNESVYINRNRNPEYQNQPWNIYDARKQQFDFLLPHTSSVLDAKTLALKITYLRYQKCADVLKLGFGILEGDEIPEPDQWSTL